jgi:hypothetical protein
MLRTFLILSLSFFATVLCAQLPDPLAELAGSTTRQWRVIGARSAVISECVPGEAWYIFQLKPAQVVVKQCEAGAMKARTEVITTWSANGKSGIAFGGARYEVKAIPATAPGLPRKQQLCATGNRARWQNRRHALHLPYVLRAEQRRRAVQHLPLRGLHGEGDRLVSE